MPRIRARTGVALGLLLGLAALAHAAPEVNLKAGLWRIGVAVEITPRVDGPTTGPIEVDRCVTPADTSNLLMTPPGARCSIEQTRFTSDVLEWKATCTQGAYTSTARGQLNFKNTRMDGRILTEARGVDMRIDTRVAGRYLGACVPLKAPVQPKPAAPGKSGPGGLPQYQPD